MLSHRSTFQVTFACTIGALACGTIAILTGFHIWFGIVAGLICGYLAYEFREVLKAVPIALRATSSASAEAWDSVLKSVLKAVRTWRSTPHHFQYLTMLWVAPLIGWLMYETAIGWSLDPKVTAGPAMFLSVLHAVIGVFALFFYSFALQVMIWLPVFIGARFTEHCYWENWYIADSYTPLSPKEAARVADEMKEKGLHREPLTYANIARWSAKGIGVIVLFFVWTLWKYAFKYSALGLVVLLLFAWHVFKLIHSSERVLCAIDGTIGGTIAYVFLISPAHSAIQNAIAVLFGIVVGAGWGVVNYEIVSKRLLKVVQATSR